MKTTLLILFSFIAVAAGAQSHRFADSTAEWNIMQYVHYSSSPPEAETHTYRVNGDTTIGTNTYQVIRKEATSWLIYIRQDSFGRVYGFLNNEEYLIADFSKQKGDSVRIYNEISAGSCPNDFVVDSVDTVFYGRYRKRMFVGLFTWIEGFLLSDGFRYHPFYPLVGCAIPHMTEYTILCFYENGERLYLNDYYDTCSYYYRWTGLDKVYDSNILLSPNPVSNNFTLTLSEQPQQSTNLLIHDAIGRLMKQEELTSTSKLVSVADLPNGMYTYTITQNSMREASGKLVVSH